jgi:chromate transporter
MSSKTPTEPETTVQADATGGAVSDSQVPGSVAFGEALRYWFKLGCISFGGPAGQIALMHDELVERRRWISEGRFLHALNYCMVLPGPEAQQLATYIGWLLHGVKGGIAAGALFVLPSLVLMIALSWLYLVAGNLPAIQGVLAGIKPAVIAIVLVTGWRIARRSLKHPAAWAVAVGAFIATILFDVSFPVIIALAALIGFLGAQRWPGSFGAGAAHTAAHARSGRYLIDDDSPVPEHAKGSRRWLTTIAAIALALGLGVYALLALTMPDGSSTLTDMARFFTSAALLTFGGAYAVLPYVVQGAVDHYGWLSTPQIIDGLALGETTPGPLIMIVAFVGFLGGWAQQALGSGAALSSGIAGAVVATFFTFLPSFVFILAGGPLVERTRDTLKVGAALAGISAAVVGVIAAMALYFGQHVLWPEGLSGRFNWVAAVIAVAAAVALLSGKATVIRVILACAVSGWLLGAAGLL